MDVSEKSFNIKENGIFIGPSKLDTCDSQKKPSLKLLLKKRKKLSIYSMQILLAMLR